MPALGLLALVLLVYYPALSGGFVWDDDEHLTANPCVVGPLGLKDIWTSAHMRICPLVQTTFWLEYRLWGLVPWPYHLVSLSLHAAVAVVLWRVLRILRVPGAWMGAALWAVHPVQVESVAWITEMKNTQSGLFFLLAVLFFCQSRSVRENETPHRTGYHYGLAVIFTALAMASKSSTVVLPLVMGLCAWRLDRAWSWRRTLPALAPLLLLSVLSAAATLWTQRAEGAFDHPYTLGLAARLVVAGKVLWFYLGKLFWPHPLIFIYPRWQIDAASLTAWLPVLAAVAVLSGLWWNRHRHPWVRGAFFAVAFFLAALLPVLGLVDTFFWRYSFVGDHFQYLAGMGPLALVGAGLAASLRLPQETTRWLRPAICSGLLVTLGGLTWHGCDRFRNEEVLWSATLRANPDAWIAHENLGAELDRQGGRAEEAMSHYEEALRLWPENAHVHFNLARDLAALPGRTNEAIAQYELALQFQPDLGWAHLNLTPLLAARPDRRAEALQHAERAVELMPDSAEARSNLAILLGKIPGREQAAIVQGRAAVRLRPTDAEAHNNLALLLTRQPGGEKEAAEHFEAALHLRPDWDEAHNNYALLLSSLPGRLPDAIAHYEEALRLRPDAPVVHNNLAGALYRAGRVSEAISHLETALQLDPGYESARRNLAAVRQQGAR